MAVVVVPALLAGVTGPASADSGLGRILNCRDGYDGTYGAWGRACLYQDLTTGAVYGAEYAVMDTWSDGKCAHVRLLWWHVNGNGYYDPGDDPHKYYKCTPDGVVKYYPDTPPRNFTYYTSVYLQVYVDGGHARSYLIYS